MRARKGVLGAPLGVVQPQWGKKRRLWFNHSGRLHIRVFTAAQLLRCSIESNETNFGKISGWLCFS